jgi:type IX secretion system substrate protein
MRFKISVLVTINVFLFNIANAQSGCTDPAASNYNPAATVNDGSCLYPVTHNTPALRGVLNTAIKESSGLVWTDGRLWTHNDSGNPAIIFSIDTTDGHTLQTVYIDNYPNTDWEDITADSNYIYVENAGNNGGSRTDLQILKIAKSDITGASIIHLNAQAINFSYTDQTSFVASSTNNFDCESVISIEDSLYIFTKDRGDLQTRVYRLPKVPGTYAVSPFTSYNVAGLITGADYDPVTGQIALIGYLSGHVSSFMWFLDDYQGHMFFSGNKRRIEISNSSTDWQTEGVGFISPHRFFISCEASGSFAASLFISDENWLAPLAVSAGTFQSEGRFFPNPVKEVLHINNISGRDYYRLFNVAGYVLAEGALQAGDNAVNLSSLNAGTYWVEVTDGAGNRSTGTIVKE